MFKKKRKGLRVRINKTLSSLLHSFHLRFGRVQKSCLVQSETPARARSDAWETCSGDSSLNDQIRRRFFFKLTCLFFFSEEAALFLNFCVCLLHPGARGIPTCFSICLRQQHMAASEPPCLLPQKKDNSTLLKSRFDAWKHVMENVLEDHFASRGVISSTLVNQGLILVTYKACDVYNFAFGSPLIPWHH